MSIDNKDLVLLAKAIEWQYELNKYTTSQLEMVDSAVSLGRRLLERKLKKTSITDWSRKRSHALLEEVQDLTLGVAEALGEDIATVVADAGSAAYAAHSSILSFGGAAANVTAVTVTAAQLKSIIVTTPVGGKTLNEWVRKTFSSNLQDKIKREIAAGLINGENYRTMAARIKKGIPGTKRELETLTRTYVQSINTQAMRDVYAANPNIVKKVRWLATMSNRTCIRCASLDGSEYKLEGHPPIPLHPNCRCVLIPITVSPAAMGLSQEVIDKAARPYSLHDGKVIGLGGAKTKDAGTFVGGFDKWFSTLSKKNKLDIVGPGRLDLLDSSKIKFADMVDNSTGRLKTLKELGGEKIAQAVAPKVASTWKDTKTVKFDNGGINPTLDDMLDGKHPLAAYRGDTGSVRDDLFMKRMNKLSGADALPVVVDRGTMDKFIEEGAEEIFRGVTDGKFAEQFKTGKFFAGRGIYGNGTYSAYGDGGFGTAMQYAGYEGRSSGGLARLTMKKDAKVISSGDLGKMIDKDYDKAHEAYLARKTVIEKKIKAGSITDERGENMMQALDKANNKAMMIYNNDGRYALSRGYDAIDVQNEEYMVILNRGAVIVQKEAVDIQTRK